MNIEYRTRNVELRMRKLNKEFGIRNRGLVRDGCWSGSDLS